jgi:hypothetical protein
MPHTQVDILTEEQRANYLATGAITCPFCGSPHIEGGSVDVDAGGASQEIGCSECNEEWIDVYTLTDVNSFA